jgi:hypothetical protein
MKLPIKGTTFRAEKVRPVLPDDIAQAVQRFAVAHSLSTTAAVSFLLSKILKQEKFLK